MIFFQAIMRIYIYITSLYFCMYVHMAHLSLTAGLGGVVVNCRRSHSPGTIYFFLSISIFFTHTHIHTHTHTPENNAPFNFYSNFTTSLPSQPKKNRSRTSSHINHSPLLLLPPAFVCTIGRHYWLEPRSDVSEALQQAHSLHSLDHDGNCNYRQ